MQGNVPDAAVLTGLRRAERTTMFRWVRSFLKVTKDIAANIHTKAKFPETQFNRLGRALQSNLCLTNKMATSIESFELVHDVVSNSKIPVRMYKSKDTQLTVAIAQIEGPLVNGYFCLGKCLCRSELLTLTLHVIMKFEPFGGDWLDSVASVKIENIKQVTLFMQSTSTLCCLFWLA